MIRCIQNCESIRLDEYILKHLLEMNFSGADIFAVKEALVVVNRKDILQCELNCYNKLGKSLVYTNNLKAGDIIAEADVNIKVDEPKGISAEEYYDVIGLKLKENVIQDTAMFNIHFK